MTNTYNAISILFTAMHLTQIQLVYREKLRIKPGLDSGMEWNLESLLTRTS